MDLNDALKVIKSLAQGINPSNGEKFLPDSPYNHPTIIRALYTILEKSPVPKKSPAEKQLENIAKGLPKNTGLPWTEENRQEVAEAFRSGRNVDELASIHERSRSAIISELVRQRIISADQASGLQGGFRFSREAQAQ